MSPRQFHDEQRLKPCIGMDAGNGNSSLIEFIIQASQTKSTFYDSP